MNLFFDFFFVCWTQAYFLCVPIGLVMAWRGKYRRLDRRLEKTALISGILGMVGVFGTFGSVALPL